MRRLGQLRRSCLPAYHTQQAFELAIQRLQITLPAQGGAHRAGFQRRWVVMYWLFEKGAHESDIGELFNRDRTSVLHGVNQVRQALKSSEAWWWQAVIDKLNRVEEPRARARTSMNRRENNNEAVAADY